MFIYIIASICGFSFVFSYKSYDNRPRQNSTTLGAFLRTLSSTLEFFIITIKFSRRIVDMCSIICPATVLPNALSIVSIRLGNLCVPYRCLLSIC